MNLYSVKVAAVAPVLLDIAAAARAVHSCEAMTELPQRALSLAGFVLAHATWSLSDTESDERLCPLAVLEGDDGDRRMTRFEADTQEEAIVAGKIAMREAKNHVAAWAFAREGAWQRMDSTPSGDVLAVDFWATGMPSVATLMQPFSRAANGGRFRVGTKPTLVVGDAVLAPDVAVPSIAAIMDGVQAHTIVAGLWPTWR